MKKQMLSILPISLILIFLFIPSMLAEEEAMNRPYDIIQEQRGYTREQLSVNQMEYSDGRWGFSLTRLHATITDRKLSSNRPEIICLKD